MKNNRHFSFPALILSAVLSILAVFFIHPESMFPAQEPTQRILWSGLFFLLIYIGGLIGMNIGIFLHARMKSIRLRRSGKWIAAALAGAVLAFGVGAGGQALFMRSVPVEIAHPVAVDIVLLLDESSSVELNGYDAARNDAALQLVDTLDENVTVQVLSFSGLVREYLPFTTADDEGKEKIRQGIQSSDLTGETGYDLPLNTALDSLSEGAWQEAGKAIVMITDGEAAVSEEAIQRTKNSGAVLFTAFLPGSGQTDAVSDSRQQLAALSSETGGVSVELQPETDGSVSAEALISAFSTAFADDIEIIQTTPEGLLVTSASCSTWQWAVRVVTILLAALINGFGFFGAVRPVSALLHLLCGAAFIGAIAAFAGNYSAVAAAGGLLLGSAFVLLAFDENEETTVGRPETGL